MDLLLSMNVMLDFICTGFAGLLETWREQRIQITWFELRDEGRDVTQSYDKNPYTDRKFQKAKWQHKDATKKLRLHNDCGPT